MASGKPQLPAITRQTYGLTAHLVAMHISSLPTEERKGLLPFARVRFEEDDSRKTVFQEISLDGLTLSLYHVMPKPDAAVYPPPFAGGGICCVLPGCGRLADLKRLRIDTFHPEDHREAAPLEPGRWFNMFGIRFGQDAADGLAGKYPELKGLQAPGALTAEARPPARPFSFNEICHEALKNILRCKQVGEVADYFIRRQAVNILTVWLRTMRLDGGAQRMSAKNRKKTAACYRYLCKNFTPPPPAESLAERFKLDVPLLEASFSARFGRSIAEFILDRRMQAAYDALTTTHATFSRIAADTGFNSTAAFRIAFRKYYRVEPVHRVKAS